MAQDMKDIFGFVLRADALRDLFGAAAAILQYRQDMALHFDDALRGFFARLDARLVVGVDANQAGVKPDGALEQSD